MFKSLFIKSILIATTLGSFTASANIVIDLFSDAQSKIEVNAGAASSSVSGGDIIGGERDIEVIAATEVTASAQVMGGAIDQLIIASNAFGLDYLFSVQVQWDGADNSAALNTSGLGGQDFSDLDGFSASIVQSDGDGSFVIDIYDMSGEFATLTLPFTEVTLGSPQDFFISFAPFLTNNPSLDLMNVGAMQLTVNGVGNTDINVAAINVVPEPSSLAIMGLALIGLAGFSSRKAK